MNRLTSPGILAFLLTALLAAGGVFAQSPQGHGGPAQAGAHGDGDEDAPTTAEMAMRDFFMEQFAHSVAHPMWPEEAVEASHDGDPETKPGALTFYNYNLFQIIALVLILLLFLPMRATFGDGRPNRLMRVFRGWVLWIRDEMVYPVMGREEGRQFAPFFVFVFFFVLFMNVVGLIPTFGVTPTSDFHVTGALALITLATMIGFGSYKQGAIRFWVNLLPHGLPVALIPLMIVVELTGLIVKPFALMVRLFANMLAGHLVIASFIGLVFVFVKMLEGSPASYLTGLPFVGFAVFIYIIESFITILQAYIFTYLSILFVQQAMHPAH